MGLGVRLGACIGCEDGAIGPMEPPMERGWGGVGVGRKAAEDGAEKGGPMPKVGLLILMPGHIV